MHSSNEQDDGVDPADVEGGVKPLPENTKRFGHSSDTKVVYVTSTALIFAAWIVYSHIGTDHNDGGVVLSLIMLPLIIFVGVRLAARPYGNGRRYSHIPSLQVLCFPALMIMVR